MLEQVRTLGITLETTIRWAINTFGPPWPADGHNERSIPPFTLNDKTYVLSEKDIKTDSYYKVEVSEGSSVIRITCESEGDLGIYENGSCFIYTIGLTSLAPKIGEKLCETVGQVIADIITWVAATQRELQAKPAQKKRPTSL